MWIIQFLSYLSVFSFGYYVFGHIELFHCCVVVLRKLKFCVGAYRQRSFPSEDFFQIPICPEIFRFKYLVHLWCFFFFFSVKNGIENLVYHISSGSPITLLLFYPLIWNATLTINQFPLNTGVSFWNIYSVNFFVHPFIVPALNYSNYCNTVF